MDSEGEKIESGLEDKIQALDLIPEFHLIPESNHTSQNKQICLRDPKDSWINRIIQEYKDFKKFGDPWGISAKLVDHEASLWSVQILGPKGTPYEGGVFQGMLQFSEHFPFTPPTFTFLTSVFHPNISEDGVVCLDQLYLKWTPCHTVWSLLLSVQFLLADANPDEPLNSIAALYYLLNRKQFDEIVGECVRSSVEDLKNDANSFQMLGQLDCEELNQLKNAMLEKSDEIDETKPVQLCKIEPGDPSRVFYSSWKDRSLFNILRSTYM